MKNKMYTINQAATFVGLTAPYVRSLIRKGKLPSQLLPLTEGSKVLRHHVMETDLIEYRDNAPRKIRRTDGRRKYSIYVRDGELDAVLEALYGADLGDVAHTIVTSSLKRLKEGVPDEEPIISDQ